MKTLCLILENTLVPNINVKLAAIPKQIKPLGNLHTQYLIECSSAEEEAKIGTLLNPLLYHTSRKVGVRSGVTFLQWF